MIYRLFAFPDSPATGLLQALPDNYQCVALREGGDSLITGPGVVVVATPAELEAALVVRRQHSAIEIVTLTESETLSAAGEVVYAALAPTLPIAVITQALANAYAHAQLREEQERTKNHLARLTTEFQDLNAIGIRLSAERDTAKLLDLIVAKAREITYADAVSFYLVEPGDTGEPVLRFTIVQNDSIPTPFKGYGIEVSSSSIAGHVALSGQPLNLDDVYALPPGSRSAPDRTHDRQIGYRTKSMLVVPLKTPDGRVIGVLQLINCKRDRVQHFTSRDEIERDVRSFPARFEDLACSLASQAAVAVENNRLYSELQAAMARLEASQHSTIQAERLRALGEMAGGLANDFNNTLAAILGRAQLLLAQSADSEVQRQLRVIEQAALDGARTMRRMLEFSRTRGRRPFQPVDFNQVVTDAMELTRGQWREGDRARGVAHDVRVRKGPDAARVGGPHEPGEGTAGGDVHGGGITDPPHRRRAHRRSARRRAAGRRALRRGSPRGRVRRRRSCPGRLRRAGLRPRHHRARDARCLGLGRGENRQDRAPGNVRRARDGLGGPCRYRRGQAARRRSRGDEAVRRRRDGRDHPSRAVRPPPITFALTHSRRRSPNDRTSQGSRWRNFAANRALAARRSARARRSTSRRRAKSVVRVPPPRWWKGACTT